MPAAVEVICPGCQGSFLVPFGIAETLCPYCDEHIVWRRCLDTDEVFPVLTRWATWVHPGCESEHLVDLTVHITQPAGQDVQHAPPAADEPAEPAPAGEQHLAPPPPPPPAAEPSAELPHAELPAPGPADALPDLDQPPTGEMLPPPGATMQPSVDDDGYSPVQRYGAPAPPPLLLLDNAEWVEERVAGQLLVVHDHVVIVARGTAQPITLAPVHDIVGYGLSVAEGAGNDEPARKKRFRRGARVPDDLPTLLRLSLAAPYAQWTIVGRGDVDLLRGHLASLVPAAANFGQSVDGGAPAFLGWGAAPHQPPPQS